MRRCASRASSGLEKGVGECDVFDLLNEGKDVSRLAAAKAVKELARGMDGKRRRLLGMKGTEAGEILGSRFLQLDVVADDTDDVRLLLERLFEVVGGQHEVQRELLV